MKKAVAVLNIGGKSISKRAGASISRAAARWGADVVVIKHELAPGAHHFWQKVFVCDHLSEYDQIVQLDADMMVRYDAPSLFDLVPQYAMGFVSARQFEPTLNPLAGRVIANRNRCLRFWSRFMGMECPGDHGHINGGLFVYSPKFHSEIWKELQRIGARYGFKKDNLPEQAALSVLAHNKPFDRFWLPETWNLTYAGCPGLRPEHSTDTMNAYIYHFCSTQRRAARMMRCRWWKCPADEIAERLPRGGSFCEVGVARGWNAAAVGHRVPDIKMTLIDGWGLHGEQYTAKADYNGGRPQSFHDDNYQAAVGLTKRFDPLIIRDLSDRALNGLPEASMDLIYIDADHTYEGARADIAAAMHAVKPGGWLGGHDLYGDNVEWGEMWGVDRACRELVPGFTEGASNTWWWQRP